ncbi:MAG: hypothetical protein Q9162_004192 [Coniocarpon cinnabarinum]
MLQDQPRAREPPAAPSWFPYLGHAYGLMKHNFEYFVMLSRQVSAPVFTVKLLGQKMYVVTTLGLIQAIQRQPRTLAFPPIEAKFASTICGASRERQEILNRNVNGDEGHWGLSMEAYDGMRAALKPGPQLDDMNRVMIQKIAAALDELQVLTQPRKIELVI